MHGAEFPWWAVAVAGLVLLLLGGVAWYLAQPPAEATAAAEVAPRTTAVRIRTNDTTGNLTLYVDGSAVGPLATDAPVELPLPVGRHSFELRDASDRVVGEAAYEVQMDAHQDFMIEVETP